MTTKRVGTKTYTKGVGQRSKRRTGIIVQSIRILVTENNLMHKAAKAEGISFNGWASRILKREAEKTMQRQQKKVEANNIG